MKIPKPIVKAISLPLFDLAHSFHVRTQMRELRRLAPAPEETVRAVQLQRLRVLFRHAWENTPFYRRRMDEAGFDRGHIERLEDLKNLPPLTRSDLQESFEEIVSKDIAGRRYKRTGSSGSTGTPVQVLADYDATSAGAAAQWFAWEQAGCDLGTPGLKLWGNPRSDKEFRRPKTRIKNALFNSGLVSQSQLGTPQGYDNLIQTARRMRAEYLYGYSNILYDVALYLESHGQKLEHVRFAFSTAENLQPYMRDKIEQTIGPVYDWYGSCEIPGVAFECPHCRQYHVVDPFVIAETGPENDGYASLILTNLNSFAMPLIRYENQDMIRPGYAPCPVFNWTTFKELSGRVSDILVLDDQTVTMMPSFFGSKLLQDLPGLVRFQVIRSEEKKLDVYLMINSRFSQEQETLIRDYMSRKFGQFNWNIRFVDEIQPSASGKYRIFIDKTKR